MVERKQYSKPEIQEVLLDVSQAVLAACKSGVNNAKQAKKAGYCRSSCKKSTGKGGSNSGASS